MSYFFTNNFRKALFDNPALMTGASFRIRLFRSAPSLSSPAAASWLDASTVAELTSFIGWEEVTGIAGYPGGMHTQSALTVRKEGLNNYVLLDQYTFDNLGSEVRIEGLGIEYASGSLNGIANPLIFVTNTPVGTFMNLDPGDILTSNQDLKLGVAANRWLLAWADTPVVPAGEPQPDWTSLRVIEGPLAFLFAPPLFESSNTLHVWLYPQRANMISNPSFEYDNSQWAPVPTRVREAAFAPVLKGTVSDEDALLALAPEVGDFYAVASDPIAQDYPIWEYKGPDPNDDLAKWTNHGVQTGKGWAGKFTAVGASPMAVESNVWETRLGYNDEETWTLQLLAKGTGKLKLALVSWDVDYRTTGVDWGTETWDLVPGAWVHCTCVRYGPQAHTAMMRIEVVSGGETQEVILDRVLAERGALKEYPYFDGDEHFGAADDFSWYGGAGRRGVSYSMWYGGRRAVIGRMFATPAVHEGELLTDVDVMAAGMVYDWVPAGVTVIPHLDVFYPTDLHGPLPPRRPTTLPPLGPDDPLGVDDPWTQEDLPAGLWLGSTVELGAAGVSGAMTPGGAANVAATAHTIWPPFTPPPVVFEYADATVHDVAVPAGVSTAILECWGAGPGAVSPLSLNGNGAYIKGTVTDLTPGEILRLTPGGIGAYAGAGGFNGGGACTGLGGSDGNGGNGASDIRRGGTALANRILIGGAGGGGINASGGGRGGHAGHPNGDIGTAFSGNGGGGTQSAGGASVAGPPNGTLGVGATSPSGPGGGRGGGGGGGGYYGGGAGASGFGTSCSGGGGSSYYHTSLSNVSAETVGTWTGAGKVKVTFILPPSEGAWGATAVGVPTTPAPAAIVGEYLLPQNLAGVDPFLSGPMVTGRTLMTIQQSGTAELWKFDLDSPGVNGGAATLTRIATSGGTFFAGHNTTGIATGGFMWGLISGPYRIAKINPTTGVIVGSAAVAYSHHTLGTDTWIYNSDGTNLITRIDPATAAVVATSPSLAGSAGFMCFDAANNALWVLSWTGTATATDRKLTRLDPLTLAIVGAQINLPNLGGKQLVPSVDVTGTYLYAVDGGTGAVYRVKISDLSVTTYSAVVSVIAANEGSPSAVIGDFLYTWHKYTLETTEAVLAKINVNTMVATYIVGYDDPYFGAHEGYFRDGASLWLLGRNVRTGSQADALIKLG